MCRETTYGYGVKISSLSVKLSPIWQQFWRSSRLWQQKPYLTSKSFEILAALGNEISENLQEAWRFFSQGQFFPSPNSYKWCVVRLKVVLRDLYSILLMYLFEKCVSYKNFTWNKIFWIHFSTLCDAYKFHRLHTGLPKRVSYVYLYCIQLLDAILKIILISSNKVKMF